MKILVQRVKSANVNINNNCVGSIDKGYLLYVCFEIGDSIETVNTAVTKIIKLRIFEDNNGKMNLSINEVNGSILSISQFTLSWDGQKGHRPSFDKSLSPVEAKILYKKFNDELCKSCRLEKGQFGADMKVESINDGPVTFFLNF